MNERIKELAEESYNEFYNVHIDLELFAELVVQECIDVINNTSNGYRDYRNQIEDAMRNACVDDIKQHFGVNDESR